LERLSVRDYGLTVAGPNSALQQTAVHDSLLGLQAHWCSAAAERGRSTAKVIVMDACDSRIDTIVTGCGAAASVALFAAVYGPAMASAPPGSGIKPGMHPLLLLALVIGYGWWVMCVAYGVRQLFVRPRRYGLFTIGFGVLQLAAVRLIEWLLMDSRGVYWATA
jgi:hypothetical protein